MYTTYVVYQVRSTDSMALMVLHSEWKPSYAEVNDKFYSILGLELHQVYKSEIMETPAVYFGCL